MYDLTNFRFPQNLLVEAFPSFSFCANPANISSMLESILYYLSIMDGKSYWYQICNQYCESDNKSLILKYWFLRSGLNGKIQKFKKKTNLGRGLYACVHLKIFHKSQDFLRKKCSTCGA